MPSMKRHKRHRWKLLVSNGMLRATGTADPRFSQRSPLRPLEAATV